MFVAFTYLQNFIFLEICDFYDDRNYRPAIEVWGKLIFLQMCVILFKEGRGVGFQACVIGHMTRVSASTWDTAVYAQQAGVTHPTGMLSYLSEVHLSKYQFLLLFEL